MIARHLHHRHAHAWRSAAAVLLLGAAGACLAGSDRETKYWVGDDGERQYGQTVPPGQGARGVRVYDGNGNLIREEPPTQTADDLNWARAQAAQQAADRTLLLSYPTVGDLLAARDRDLADIDSEIRTARDNTRNQEESVGRLRSEAADSERSGKTAPPHLVDGIARAERSIRDYRASIQSQGLKKEKDRRDFDLKLQRLRQLTDGTNAAAPPDRAPGGSGRSVPQ